MVETQETIDPTAQLIEDSRELLRRLELASAEFLYSLLRPPNAAPER
jgi:hypothetical protein